MKQATPRKPPIYHFEKLDKKTSMLIVDEQGNTAIYTTALHLKVSNAVYSWRTNKNFKSRLKTKFRVQKSKEFDEEMNEWYNALRVKRIK